MTLRMTQRVEVRVRVRIMDILICSFCSVTFVGLLNDVCFGAGG